MTDPKSGQPQAPENQNDEDAIAFAQGIFELARNGAAGFLAPLLGAGVPVDVRTSDGQSLLMLAAEGGHTDTVQLLIESGAHVDLTDHRGQTALMVAARGNHGNVVARLLAAGAATDLTNDNHESARDLARSAGADAALAHLPD